MTESLFNKVAGLRPLSNFYDGTICRNSLQTKTVKYFLKKLHHECLIRS